VLPYALLSQWKQEGHLKAKGILSTTILAQETGKAIPHTDGQLPELCHLKDAKIQQSAFHPLLPTYCQGERRKKAS